jgi:hypothetical protein
MVLNVLYKRVERRIQTKKIKEKRENKIKKAKKKKTINVDFRTQNKLF